MLRGLFFVVSAPSGAGKTALARRVVKEVENLYFSISHTTRAPRADESDGVDYHFISREQFQEKIEANDFAEWAKVHGNLYGTSQSFLNEHLSQGHDVILDIDVQGGEQLRRTLNEGVFIFVMPPSLATLEQRLRGRGSDAEEEIQRRLRRAQEELASVHNYDYVIINQVLEEAIGHLEAVIQSERLGRGRYEPPDDIAPFIARKSST